MTRRHKGMALISAIFLVVTLVAVAAAMVTLSNVSHDTGTKSLYSAKVYYGAKAGLDWGIQRAISDPAPAARCTNFASPAGVTFALTGGGLADVSVTVACSSTLHGAGNLVYYITSVATTGTIGNLNYAERHMEATVTTIP